VDEITCIGCKNCVWQAPACFRIEPEHGRSRVFAQVGVRRALMFGLI
jgi:ferredoxin